MLTRKLLGTSLCVAALGWGAARLYGEVMLVPNASADCVDGVCVPRRVTNGYFPTKWRQWPVEPPARPEPGVRPGIPAPPVELPVPSDEIRLPAGSIAAPGPAPDQGPAPESDTIPRNGPLAPPADRGAPEAEPRPDLPPALRNALPPPAFDEQGSRLPSDHRSPRRIPTLASRARNRPAVVVEALGAEGHWKPADDGSPGADSRVPGILPRDEMQNAEPLRKTRATTTPRRPTHDSVDDSASSARSNPNAFAYSQERAGWIEQFSHSAPATTRLGARLSALRASTSGSDDSTGWVASEPEEDAIDGPALQQSSPRTSQSSLRLPAGLNTPAALGVRNATAGVTRASAVADLTISAPDSSAVLAVRTVGEDGWNASAPAGNPLRGSSRITRVAFESAEPDENVTAASGPTVEAPSSDFNIPTNPLR